MKKNLHDIIEEFKRSNIQSEAEVRSKLIVPLTEYLGYPSWLRAEEFPVYGFEGRTRLPAKNADYIFFTDKDFANYREFKNEELDWVKEHSLLVIEAKKTKEMPEVLGQPIYYTIWTRAVAYLITDGISIKGCFFNPISSDKKILDCKVAELEKFSNELQNFSYENIRAIKKLKQNSGQFNLIETGNFDQVEGMQIPEETINYMREALGKNANGRDDVGVVSLFCDSTAMYLKNEMRYDIPEYMYEIPRETVEAELYIDENIFPYQKGKVTHNYWKDNDLYLYESEYIDILFEFSKNVLKNFEMGYHVLDNCVTERLESFKKVEKCMNAKNFSFVLNNGNKQNMLSCHIGRSKKIWKSREAIKEKMKMWVEELEKMRALEEYYGLSFKLEHLSGAEHIAELYTAVDYVYDGISMNQNCVFRMPGGLFNEDIIIEQPTIFQENTLIDLPSRWIHGFEFIPDKTAILPGTLAFKNTTKEDIVVADMCCLYRVEKKNKPM
ncbi:hypothetical protein H8739_01105 [Blautia faecis]|uniref:hypothetical protein n=1 Tax=Blautia faecis TaxID=871665 RepID=UPI0016553C55|nr:hypothetical protein [Blautia faecis]MBC8612322.1 hypothetical protein [Blautia faecis]